MIDNFTGVIFFPLLSRPASTPARVNGCVVCSLWCYAIVFLFYVGVKCWIREVLFVTAPAAKLTALVIVFASSTVLWLLVVSGDVVATAAFVSILVVFRVVFFVRVFLRLLLLLGALVAWHCARFHVIHLLN